MANIQWPVTWAVCRSVNSRGVPVQLKDTPYYDDYLHHLFNALYEGRRCEFKHFRVN
jgi:hypothetical protein